MIIGLILGVVALFGVGGMLSGPAAVLEQPMGIFGCVAWKLSNQGPFIRLTAVPTEVMIVAHYVGMLR